MSQLGSHHHSLFAPIALFLFIFSLLPVSLGSTTWPLPLNATTGRRLLYFHRHFTFRTDGRPSSLLSKAFDRYTDIILDYSYPADDTSSTFGKALGELSSRDAIRCVVVEVVSSDQSLGLQTSETYTLRVAAPTTIIEATTVHGALRGLETLAQLAREVPVDSRTSVLLPADVTAEGLIGGDVNSDLDVIKEVLLQKAVDMLDPAAYDGVDRHHRRHHKHRRHRHRRLSVIKETAIYDTPRFRYRGLLIDSARHYLPVSIIKVRMNAQTTGFMCLRILATCPML